MEKLKTAIRESKLAAMTTAYQGPDLRKKFTIALNREQNGAQNEVLRMDLGSSSIRFLDGKAIKELIKNLQEFTKEVP